MKFVPLEGMTMTVPELVVMARGGPIILIRERPSATRRERKDYEDGGFP